MLRAQSPSLAMKNRAEDRSAPLASLSHCYLARTDAENSVATTTTTAPTASVLRGDRKGVTSREWRAVRIHSLKASYGWRGGTGQGSTGHGDSAKTQKNETDRGRSLPVAGCIRTNLQP